jgi:hypothetical protein
MLRLELLLVNLVLCWLVKESFTVPEIFFITLVLPLRRLLTPSR